MSTVLDFSGVSDNSGNNLYVQPGVQVLTITEIEHVATPGAKEYLNVTTESEHGGSFKTKFYLTAAALPKLQHIAKNFTGSEFEGKVTVEEMIAKLVGTSARCIVDGELVTNAKGNDVTYARLNRFLGFAQPVDSPNPFKADSFKVDDKRAANTPSPLDTPKEYASIDLSQDEESDLPF